MTPIQPMHWRLAVALLAMAALACNLIGPTAAPASPTPAPPGSSPTTAPTTGLPTVAPTPTAPGTGPATALPPGTPSGEPGPEAILILEPGLTSAVTSPVRVAGEADPTFEQNLVVQITDADGNPVGMQPTTIQADAGQRGPFEVEVAFTVPSEQPGRISVYHTSAADGGLVHLASVEVRLRPGGSANLLPGRTHPEDIAIFTPAHLERVSGGLLRLTGFAAPVFENTLVVALCGEGGSGPADPACGHTNNVLARGIAMVQAPDIGQPGPFETDLTYSVAAETRGRVVVYAASARDGGIIHLTSRPVILAP